MPDNPATTTTLGDVQLAGALGGGTDATNPQIPNGYVSAGMLAQVYALASELTAEIARAEAAESALTSAYNAAITAAVGAEITARITALSAETAIRASADTALNESLSLLDTEVVHLAGTETITGTKTFAATIEILQDGAGLRLHSPDGSQTKTIAINNNGNLVLI